MKLDISISVGGVPKGSKQVTTPCIIGRSKDVNLPVAHPVMSRKHCELFEKDGNLYLRDNSSLNGTIYKGGYIEGPTSLTTGDEFMVGELTFKVTILNSSLTEEQQEIADDQTTAIPLESTNNATILDPPSSDSDSNIVTILEPPQNPNTPTNETAPSKKNSKKISPKDVRIVT
ncbi:MAG: FHA domain-containing protein [Planctomycetaceae bacterium]|jgi:pSer/pThr/pTyr-binding forkhead associated (FHA) protein|nr:FHA domain-containing protein [Planctomycetaceae bacterium]